MTDKIDPARPCMLELRTAMCIPLDRYAVDYTFALPPAITS